MHVECNRREGMRKARMRRCKFSVALRAEKWMHFLWMRRRELDDIYISHARVRVYYYIRRQLEVSVSLSLSNSPYILFDDLQNVDHEDLSAVSQWYLSSETRRHYSWFFPWAPFISSLHCLWRCIAEGNASRRAACANCNLRTSRRTYTYKDSVGNKSEY